MRIGIDARFVGPQGTGLGKYTEKLIFNLQKVDKKNQYFIFLRKNNWDYLKLNNKFKKVIADIPWYSLEEQIKMPAIFNSQYLDLLHIPHFNAPYFYRKKYVVTIHDLIHHHFEETSTTTKNLLTFRFKRFGYRLIIRNAIERSVKILVPSNFVKAEIIRYFKINPQKIVVTYEAAEGKYFTQGQRSKVKGQRSNTLLYVGNAYPHKNLNRLLEALSVLNFKFQMSNVKLIIVCPRDTFAIRLKKEIAKRHLQNRVALKGYLNANDLIKVFLKTSVYVFPSLSEGFGIPGLNAMALGIPVTASDIPTLKEIYGDAALYFNPKDPNDIASKIKKALSNVKTRTVLVEKGRVQAKKYSWLKMAEETLEVYRTT